MKFNTVWCYQISLEIGAKFFIKQKGEYLPFGEFENISQCNRIGRKGRYEQEKEKLAKSITSCL